MWLESSSLAGLTPLVAEKGVASQPMLSRFTAITADPRNLAVLREGSLEFATDGLRARSGGCRLTGGVCVFCEKGFYAPGPT
jgi:hypothetical protein